MDIVLRESERLNGIIRDFLAYARPQRAAMALIDVRQVLTETARLLENNAELAAGHEIAVTVPDDPVWFRADGAQIRQIVWNLATNGLRAMPSGGRLRLGLRQTPAGDGSGDIVIVVEDQGVGIPPDEVDGIFQPFRGAFTRGTGLGLSIVHRIVTDYGGEVRVTSHRGVGTTIEVTLPVAPAPLAPVDPPALQVSAS
jgi:two-component system sensor histidine kinase PilS (NtrC family)